MSVSPRWRPKLEMTWRTRSGHRDDQYNRDIVKPAGLKNDVNGMRSIERN